MNRLLEDYRQYGALYSAVEKGRPTAANTCFELQDAVARVRPLLNEQEKVIVDSGTLYDELARLGAEDQTIKATADAGKAAAAKARERVRKYGELMDITASFVADCPTEGEMFVHILTGVTAFGAIGQYHSAKEKAPMFNRTLQQVEQLSAEEKALAYKESGRVTESADGRREPGYDRGARAGEPIWYAVDLTLETAFGAPVTLESLRRTPGLADMVLLRRGSRLSVQPVTADEWKIVTRLGGA